MIVQDIVPRAIIPLWLLIVPTEDTPKIGHVQRPIVWTFFILSHTLVSPFTVALRFARKLRSPCMARKASVMQATPGCPVPIFSYFFLTYSYFVLFFFSILLAGEAKICNKIENGIIVICFPQSEIYHKASSMFTLMFRLILAKIMVTFVVPMSSIKYWSSVNKFVLLLLFYIIF